MRLGGTIRQFSNLITSMSIYFLVDLDVLRSSKIFLKSGNFVKEFFDINEISFSDIIIDLLLFYCIIIESQT